MSAVVPSLLPAILLARQRRAVRRFADAGALTPQSARRPREVGVGDGRIVRLLARRGVLVATADDRHYLDVAAWERLRSRRRRLAMLSLALVLVGVALALGLGR
jgi:hypothetical protein